MPRKGPPAEGDGFPQAQGGLAGAVAALCGRGVSWYNTRHESDN